MLPRRRLVDLMHLTGTVGFPQTRIDTSPRSTPHHPSIFPICDRASNARDSLARPDKEPELATLNPLRPSTRPFATVMEVDSQSDPLAQLAAGVTAQKYVFQRRDAVLCRLESLVADRELAQRDLAGPAA